MEGTASFGGKRTLVERQLGLPAKVRERQRHHGLLVVGSGLLPPERVGEPGGRSDVTELPLEEERLALRRLHLDPIAATDAEVELEAG
jgi:hypothetical protein